MTRVTSPTGRSVHRTLDLSFGCGTALLLLDRLGRVHRWVLERGEERDQGVDLPVFHQFLVLIRHFLLLVFLLKSLRHPTLRIENLLLKLFRRHEVTDVVHFRPSFLAALSEELVTVVAFLKLPLL